MREAAVFGTETENAGPKEPPKRGKNHLWTGTISFKDRSLKLGEGILKKRKC